MVVLCVVIVGGGGEIPCVEAEGSDLCSYRLLEILQLS